MNYLSNEEKKEYKEAKRFFGFEATKFIVLMVALLFILGGVSVGYKLTIGKANADANREVFKHTEIYSEGVASNLAKSYKEYNSAETEKEKTVIMNYVIMMYPNLDIDTIENDTLRQFYLKCINN